MIGVSSNGHSAAELKEITEKERLNWRSFALGQSVAEGWNAPATPSYYVIDRRGVIRRKWMGYPGEEALDAALERALEERDSE